MIWQHQSNVAQTSVAQPNLMDLSKQLLLKITRKSCAHLAQEDPQQPKQPEQQT